MSKVENIKNGKSVKDYIKKVLENTELTRDDIVELGLGLENIGKKKAPTN